jgi:beta-N-acetylhexosaminidase
MLRRGALFAVVTALAINALPAVVKRPATNKPATKKSAGGKKTAPSALPATDQATAARWLKTLTLREQIAQLVIIPFSGHPLNTRTREYRKFTYLMSTEHVGGLILINVPNGRTNAKADPLEVASFLNRMQKLAKVPLIVAGDFERGVSMRLDSTTIFPHAMAFTAAGDPGLVRAQGQITAREARAIGFHWILYPDADVNNNPDNPIINIRSFGESPADVSKMATAFIEGAHAVRGSRVLVTAKHFPGHGDTATDTHFNLATIPVDRARLEQVEWVPFRAAIQAGVDSVMSAHLAVPALEAPDLPATLSPKLLNGVLRGDMGFKGIIVTDALQMGGIAQGFPAGEAAVRALQAGADVLMMPPDPEAAINAVVAAVRSGRLTRKRIEESATRLLTAKARLGLASKKLVDLDAIHGIVNSAESNAVAAEVTDRSVTLVRNRDDMIPLKSPQSTAFFVLSESRTGIEGQAMALEIRKRAANATVIQVDATMGDADLQTAIQHAGDATQYVVAAFASVAAFHGTVPLGGGFPQFVQNLIATQKPVALVALGNPYLLRTFPDVAAYMTGYSTVPPAEVSAVKALFGEIAIGGKLPVTIPGFANYGDGIVLPVVSRQGEVAR